MGDRRDAVDPGRGLLARHLLILLLAGFGGLSAAPAAQDRKPNVIIIFTDDQGSIDTHLYGAKDLVTPNMDALARGGIRFTQFYAGSAVCSPSRASLMTGRVPIRAGLAGNAPSQHGKPGLPASEVTMAEMFKTAGYATGHVGKWHLGYTPETMPNGQGFDSSFGHMGGCIDNYSHYFYWSGPNVHDLWRNGKEVYHEGEFFGDLMVDECGRFIEANRDRPFFLYWAINMPHYPLQATQKWRDHYRNLDALRGRYAAFVSTVDEAIGRVLARLDALGLTKDTIVVFQSDHGHSTETRTFGGGGNAGPYRGAKFSLFEGGIRVPAFIRWPARLKADQVRGQVAVSVDWYPTLAELCGVPLPAGRTLDGRSLVPMLMNPEAPSPHDVCFWDMGNQWAVRRGPWKLIGNPKDTSGKGPLGKNDRLFLSNLEKDITEMKNFAAGNPELVQELKKLHDDFTREVRK